MKFNNNLPFQPNSPDEVAIFLDQVLQWICDLESPSTLLFGEEQVSELGKAIAKKFGFLVVCDFDRNYRSSYRLNVLIEDKVYGKLKDKERNLTDKNSSFQIQIDISHKGFFCLRSYLVTTEHLTKYLTPLPERPLSLQKTSDKIARFLTQNNLIQVPEILLDRSIQGRNELGGQVTVRSQLFGEV